MSAFTRRVTNDSDSLLKGVIQQQWFKQAVSSLSASDRAIQEWRFWKNKTIVITFTIIHEGKVQLVIRVAEYYEKLIIHGLL